MQGLLLFLYAFTLIGMHQKLHRCHKTRYVQDAIHTFFLVDRVCNHADRTH